MKKFISEFKEFIAKGDVMSMAVGIITLVLEITSQVRGEMAF